MKIRKYGAAFLPPILALIPFALETNFFTSVRSCSPLLLALCSLLFVASSVYIWSFVVVNPARAFLHTINRAIEGDFLARFSCEKRNANFFPLSHSFNKFMTIMENQTTELLRNRAAQSQLYEHEKIYRTALELTCERVFEADLTHNRFLYGLEVYSRVFPFLKTEMYDEMVKEIADRTVFKEEAEAFRSTFSRANLISVFSSGSTKEITMEYRQQTSERTFQWMLITVISICSGEAGNLTVIGYVKNIDERKRHELEMVRQSQKDGLTGLYNKVVTQSLVESYLSGDGLNGKHAVIMLDVDDFKNINDSLGHIEGDYALAQVANRMQSLFRSTDILGRVGGDEFLILIKNYGSKGALNARLESLSAACRQVCLGRDGLYSVTGSIGVALYPQDGTTYRELYQKADDALYRSKGGGKNRFSFYEDLLTAANAQSGAYSMRLSR